MGFEAMFEFFQTFLGIDQSYIIPSYLILIHRNMRNMDIMDYEDQCPSDEEKVQLNKAINGMGISNVMNGWSELYLKDQIKKALRENGFEAPSQVQKAAIPIIMQGRDMLCQARSGMGKTAVFIIGVLNKLSLINGEYTPFNTLIICHTRELAHQVNRDFRRFCRHFKNPQIRIGCFFGGLSLDTHKKQLTNKPSLPHIIIGSPGRLKDLLGLKLLPLNKIQHFIIDQCDKILLDFKMLSIVKALFQQMPRQKQVLMFSATMTPSSIKIAKQFLTDQQTIFIDTGKLVIPGLQQYYYIVEDKEKLDKLMYILDRITFNQGVIFVNRIEKAARLTNLLIQKLFNPICIHSRMPQGERIISYDSFKANKFRILVATDLFGRGVDVERVNLVINYDFPRDRETYLHRIGRAGRFNTRGVAISFICPNDDPTQQEALKNDSQVFKEIEAGLKYNIIQLPKNLQDLQ